MEQEKSSEQNETIDMFPFRFIESLMEGVTKDMDESRVSELLRGCSCTHYQILDMESLVSKYSGRLHDFIAFIESEWGWKIIYDESCGVIEVDENKPFCVCPLVQKGHIKNPVLCHCSEGFNTKMFSAVVGKPVNAEVVRSVLQGDESCVYRIKIIQDD